MFRHKSKDKSKKYIKLGEGNVFTLLNTNQKDSPKRDLTEQEQKVIKLLSAHKSYFNSNQAKAMLTDEDYLKYCKYNSFFEKCADFQREYYKLVECTILESKGQRAGLIDFELNLFRQLVDKKEHEFYIIDPQECVHMLSERIMDNLEAASFIIWMGFARQLYKEVTQQKAVEFDKESFVCPKEKRSGKPINFFYSSKVFKLMSIMSIVYMDYSLKKDFIEGLYFSRKIINEAMRETRFSDSSHKYLANDDVDLNKMYLYERGIKVSRGLEKCPQKYQV